MLYHISFQVYRNCRSFSTCGRLLYPRGKLNTSKEFIEGVSHWKQYVEDPNIENEIGIVDVMSPTNFGAVRLDSANQPKFHGAFDTEFKNNMNTDDIDNVDKVSVLQHKENLNENFEKYDTSEEGYYLDEPLRPEDRIPEIEKLKTKTKKTKLEKNIPVKTKVQEEKVETANEISYDNSVNYKPNKLHLSEDKKYSNKLTKAKEKKTNEKKPTEIKNVMEHHQTPTMNAYEFVKQIRKKSFEQQIIETKPKKLDKETEILQLGKGLQSRMKDTVVLADSKTSKNRSDIQELEEISKPFKGGKVNPKFLPHGWWGQNMNKLSSVEVEDILKKGVLYDKRKFFTNGQNI